MESLSETTKFSSELIGEHPVKTAKHIWILASEHDPAAAAVTAFEERSAQFREVKATVIPAVVQRV